MSGEKLMAICQRCGTDFEQKVTTWNQARRRGHRTLCTDCRIITTAGPQTVIEIPEDAIRAAIKEALDKGGQK